ncbi:MAG: hypothetical protein N2Z65_07945, partial [Clostridiales bacterium]|nr:hypothetical protein [Clostridiales bacterium]
AYAFMNAVYRKTNRSSSILFISFLAAGIKLVDLFITVQIQKVINPAVAIILEGMSVFAICIILDKMPQLNRYKLGKAFSASMLQEILYIIYVFVTPILAPSYAAIAGAAAYITYLYHGLINAVLIFAFSKYFTPLAHKIVKPNAALLSSLRQKKAVNYILTASPYLLLIITIYAQLVM